jgi:hypothetical protein
MSWMAAEVVAAAAILTIGGGGGALCVYVYVYVSEEVVPSAWRFVRYCCCSGWCPISLNGLALEIVVVDGGECDDEMCVSGSLGAWPWIDNRATTKHTTPPPLGRAANTLRLRLSLQSLGSCSSPSPAETLPSPSLSRNELLRMQHSPPPATRWRCLPPPTSISPVSERSPRTHAPGETTTSNYLLTALRSLIHPLNASLFVAPRLTLHTRRALPCVCVDPPPLVSFRDAAARFRTTTPSPF